MSPYFSLVQYSTNEKRIYLIAPSVSNRIEINTFFQDLVKLQDLVEKQTMYINAEFRLNPAQEVKFSLSRLTFALILAIDAHQANSQALLNPAHPQLQQVHSHHCQGMFISQQASDY